MTRHGTLAFVFSLVAASILPLAPTVSAQDASPVLAARDDAALGSILTDSSGWTLYTFANDGPGTSACVGPCASAWPALLVNGDEPQPDLPRTVTAFWPD